MRPISNVCSILSMLMGHEGASHSSKVLVPLQARPCVVCSHALLCWRSGSSDCRRGLWATWLNWSKLGVNARDREIAVVRNQESLHRLKVGKLWTVGGIVAAQSWTLRIWSSLEAPVPTIQRSMLLPLHKPQSSVAQGLHGRGARGWRRHNSLLLGWLASAQ